MHEQLTLDLWPEGDPNPIVEEPKTKMWQWVIKRGNARPEATFEYYSSESCLLEDLNPLDIVIIQRADWTEISMNEGDI